MTIYMVLSKRSRERPCDLGPSRYRSIDSSLSKRLSSKHKLGIFLSGPGALLRPGRRRGEAEAAGPPKRGGSQPPHRSAGHQSAPDAFAVLGRGGCEGNVDRGAHWALLFADNRGFVRFAGFLWLKIC